MRSKLGLKKPPQMGSRAASAGHVVCSLTPTTRGPAPMAKTISPTAGDMQMMRR